MTKSKAKLTVIAERADPDIVKMLEDALADARRGGVRSIAIAMAGKGGFISTRHILWSNDRPGAYMALRRLEQEILDTSR